MMLNKTAKNRVLVTTFEYKYLIMSVYLQEFVLFLIRKVSV